MNNKWVRLGIVAIVVLLLGGIVIAVNAQGFMNPGGHMGWGGDSLVAVAAEALGMEQADLIAELQNGKTIADLATEKEVALDTIVEAFIATRADAIANAVEAGTLTQEQADVMLANMRAHLTLHLSEPFTGMGMGPMGGMMGRGMGRGMMGRGMGGMWGHGMGHGMWFFDGTAPTTPETQSNGA
jgi:hypothetical protein